MFRAFLFAATASIAMANAPPGSIRRLEDPPATARIIGGTPSILGQFPTYVTPTNVLPMETRCGGIMVATDLFLTAASCDIFQPGRAVAIGGIMAGGGDAQFLLQTVETYPHPEFSDITFAYDIMLVRLNGATPALDPSNSDMTIPSMGTVIGYGGTPNGPSLVLEDVQVTVTTADVCGQVNDGLALDVAVQLCAGSAST